MNLLTRKRLWALVTLTAALCVAVGVTQTISSAATKITITEEDYFNTPGQIAALAAYSKQFEAAHAGVTVKRQYVPFANLDTKLLTQAAGHDLPNLLAVDNPFVSTHDLDGPGRSAEWPERVQHEGVLPCRDQ